MSAGAYQAVAWTPAGQTALFDRLGPGWHDVIVDVDNPALTKTGCTRSRLAIVSYNAGNPYTPRGERTRELRRAFESTWDVEMFSPRTTPTKTRGGARGRSSLLRRVARVLVLGAMYDPHELWSARRFLRWHPEVDAALLIGYPFSPCVHAARRLKEASVPYVVDTGDPWALHGYTGHSYLGHWRAVRADRALWKAAAGGIVTTSSQARALTESFPGLPILVRPNGYKSVEQPPSATRRRVDRQLRLVHFGMLSSIRLDVVPFLARLTASGLWDKIVFTQFGDDYAEVLNRASETVQVEHHDARPWEDVVGAALDYDLAVVVGNMTTGQLPSKAVQYLTLPIPRMALVLNHDDALAAYTSRMPGWLVLSSDAPDQPQRVHEHITREWPAEALEPPASEAWAGVAREIIDFVEGCVIRA